MMGWTPQETRAALIPDIIECADGWLVGRGMKKPEKPEPTEAEIEAFRRAMAEKRRQEAADGR